MPDGYEIRGNTVRVYFRYEGELCREKVGKATPDNVDRARRLAQIIKLELESGTFDYGRHFPDSAKLEEKQFGYWVQVFLDIKKTRIRASTLRGYEQKLSYSVLPRWGSCGVVDIDHVDVQRWVSTDLAHLSNKTIKELLALMGQVIDLYGTRHKLAHNPCRGILLPVKDDEEPDPFTRAEIQALVSTDTDRINERNLIEFMIWDGPRVSEAISLAWEDVVDLQKGIIRYERSRVRGDYAATKTKRSRREHQLLPAAHRILLQQHAMTAQLPPIESTMTERDNKTKRVIKIRPVFRSTGTGLGIHSDKAIRADFFQEHCEKAGVRYRPPSHTRHTFISQMLTLGIAPLHWIAMHVGHTTTAMIQKRYGRWINEDGQQIYDAVARALEADQRQ